MGLIRDKETRRQGDKAKGMGLKGLKGLRGLNGLNGLNGLIDD